MLPVARSMHRAYIAVPLTLAVVSHTCLSQTTGDDQPLS